MADTTIALKAAGDTLVIKGFTGQTADILEIQDVSGNVLAKIEADGVIHTNKGLVILGSKVSGSAGQEYNRLANIQDPDASYATVMVKGNLPVNKNYAETWAGEDTTGNFGKGFVLLHDKTAKEWKVGYSSSGVWDASEVYSLIVKESGVDMNGPSTTTFTEATHKKVFKAHASQSANLVEFQDSSAAVLSSFGADGKYSGRIVVPYGEIFAHGNATATVINAVDELHLVTIFSNGEMSGVSAVAGSTGAITDTGDSTGQLQITSNGHSLTSGEVVSITGLTTAAQNGLTRVTVVDVNTFDCDDISYATASETGAWQRGHQLKIATGNDGVYRVGFNATVTSAGDAKKYRWVVVKNITEKTNISVTRVGDTGASEGSISASGLVDLAAGDIISLAVEGNTDATNLTHVSGNLNLSRVS
jgi:hypothetical protein